ncbi:VOC family protein [Jannaschia sp. LMIT008]|uniref:VOC family protein n=1 Tax=Jannaschia maritima TaxID=3032585 RepID=UPI002811C7D5|nr:VOC family protein [Jannaschia sp. LMIT008]
MLTDWSIHHVNLQARDVRRAAAFYTAVLGLAERPWAFPATRGYLPGDPDKLALLGDGRDGHSGLHLIAPDDDFARKNDLLFNPSKGGHVAIRVPDLDAVIARLRDAGIPHSVTGEFAIPGLRHVYLEDPEGNLLELNGPVRGSAG